MEVCSTPAVPILEEVLAAFVCGTSVSPQPRTDTTSEDTSMNKFSAAHVQRGSHACAAHMSRVLHVTGAEESSWNASARPARSTDAEISFGTSAHGLPAQTDAKKSFGTPVHGLPAFTDGVVLQRQPRPASQLCPPLAIVSVFYMFVWLTCRRGSHVSDAEISFGKSVHGVPASTDADFSERQRTACPHHDSIISCGALAYGLVSESLGQKKKLWLIRLIHWEVFAHLEIRLVGLAKFVGGSVKLF